MRTPLPWLVPCLSFLACSAGSSGAGSTSSSSSSGAGVMGTYTTITVDQANAAVAFTRLPNGHFVLVEGQAKRVLETDETGHVLHVNSADFTDLDWPNEAVADDSGRIFIVAYNAVFTYAQSITDTRETWLARDGNHLLAGLTFGGTPRKLWAVQAGSGTAPMRQLVRFDSATGSAPGAPTVIKEFDRAGYLLAVDDSNNVYMSDSNACRILKVDAAGTVTVVVGTELGTYGACYNGGSLGRTPERVGQGRGLALHPSRSRMVFSDGTNHALIDVTSEGTSRADATRILATFPDTTNTEQIVTAPDALYALDVANHAILRVVF